MPVGILVLLIVMLWAPIARAEFYSFEDSNGVMHFVDDRNKIPAQYRNKTQVRKDRFDDLSEKDRALMLDQERRDRQERQEADQRRALDRKKARQAKEKAEEQERRRKELTTPVVISGLQVFVPVTLTNGNAETQANLLLDTGATTTLITPEVAERLKIDKWDYAKITVVGGKVLTARTAVLSEVKVGPASRKNQQVVIVTQRGGGFGDGLIGMNFFAGFKYTIDFRTQTINWIP